MRRSQDCYVTETLGIPARIPTMCRDSTMKLVANLKSRQEFRQCVGIHSWFPEIASLKELKKEKNQGGRSHQSWQMVYGLP